MLSIIIALPFACSIAGFIWSKYFDLENNFPASKTVYYALIITQILGITLVLSLSNSIYPKLFCSFLYLMQSLGVMYLMNKKGKVECGCFGSLINSNLSWKLVLLNISFAFLSYLSIYDNASFSPIEGILIELLLVLFGAFLVTGLPDVILTISEINKKLKKDIFHYKI